MGINRTTNQIDWIITDFHNLVGWRLMLPLRGHTLFIGKNPNIFNSLNTGQVSWRMKKFTFSSITTTICEFNILTKSGRKHLTTLSIGLLWLTFSARLHGLLIKDVCVCANWGLLWTQLWSFEDFWINVYKFSKYWKLLMLWWLKVCQAYLKELFSIFDVPF